MDFQNYIHDFFGKRADQLEYTFMFPDLNEETPAQWNPNFSLIPDDSKDLAIKLMTNQSYKDLIYKDNFNDENWGLNLTLVDFPRTYYNRNMQVSNANNYLHRFKLDENKISNYWNQYSGEGDFNNVSLIKDALNQTIYEISPILEDYSLVINAPQHSIEDAKESNEYFGSQNNKIKIIEL